MSENGFHPPPKPSGISGEYRLKLDEALQGKEEELVAGKIEFRRSNPPKIKSDPPQMKIDIVEDPPMTEGDRQSVLELQEASNVLSSSVEDIVDVMLTVLGRLTGLSTHAHRQLKLVWVAVLLMSVTFLAQLLMLRTLTQMFNKMADLEAKSSNELVAISQLVKSANQTATSTKKTAEDVQEIKAEKQDISIVSDRQNQAKLVIRPKPATSSSPTVGKSIEIPIKLPIAKVQAE